MALQRRPVSRRQRTASGVLERHMMELEVADILKKLPVEDRVRLEEIGAGLTEGPQILLSGARRSTTAHFAQLSLRELQKCARQLQRAGLLEKNG